MPISLILAIIDLIIKLPEIIDAIRKIIEAIHNRPIHLQGALIVRLHDIVKTSTFTDKKAALEEMAADLLVQGVA